ncbi:hypothetical protein [Lichenibacterium ramalinae]|uniref:Uncharacterized protein n=1 Tax=Lichenibacterium ramalinae TaxID=2316527 RepID=A0A4Q2R7F8_9HYPH|nr:hypothetical protein [Lichenibacterium ramalinae]RYB01891.1 hypothetical protein D3272_23605 [Lichenibacterium ramalinae]
MLATAADSVPDEPVSVTRMGPRQVFRELEQARASITWAERRYAEMMAPAYQALGDALDVVHQMSSPQRDAAADICASLRDRGFTMVEASRA